MRRVTRFVPKTFDRVVNKYCSEGNTFVLQYPSKVLLCIKDNKAHMIGETTHQKNGGKKISAFARVLGRITNSSAREKFSEKELGFDDMWFNQNKTCMTGRRDTSTCIDKNGKFVVDNAIERKPCFFVHGVGEKGNNTIKSNFIEYWGQLKTIMPQCNSFNFLYMDTKTYSWNSDWLNRKVCELITGGSMKITNSYVFTHSMGGLIMTRSLMRGFCQIDKSSARLYMSQPPLKGSITARYVNDICKGLHGELMQKTAVDMDYCLPDNQGAYPAYYPMDPANPELKSVMYAAGVFNDGMLCGNCSLLGSVCGFGSPGETAGLKAIAVFSDLQFPNDGMVALDSCQVTNPKEPFTGDSNSRYYRDVMNHADGTCRNGDSSLLSLYPCQWFATKYISS